MHIIELLEGSLLMCSLRRTIRRKPIKSGTYIGYNVNFNHKDPKFEIVIM